MRLLPAIGLAATMVATPAAQSLGDLAKQEEARRKAIKTPGKVITNDTLRAIPVSSPGSVPASTPASGKDSDAAADKKSKSEDSKAKDAAEPKAGEAAWKALVQEYKLSVY